MSRFSISLVSVVVLASSLAASQTPPPPNLPDMLERVSTYLNAFEKDYSRVIADERYQQTLKEKRVQALTDKTMSQTVDIRSDILAAPDLGNRWLSFRDVFSVNGRAVRDRDSRLQKLFEKAGANRFEEAKRIADEGARINLGTLSRNINVPSMPLTFITPENRSRCAFRVAGSEVMNGTPAVILEFKEMARPTLVRNGSNDLASEGTYWIEPESGRVLKAMIKLAARDFSSEMTVTFGLNEKLKMWVPVDMVDSSENARELITGHAVYTNYRRFDTSVVIK